MTDISRRRLLRGSALTLLGLALTTGGATAATGEALPRPPAPPPPWTAAARSAVLRDLPTGKPQYSPPAPIQLTATHSLSDDAFLTTDVLLGMGANQSADQPDQVQAIVRADGRVEAIVLSVADNKLYHLRRDPTQPSGWAYELWHDPQQYTIGSFTAAYHPDDGNVYLMLRLIAPTWGDWLAVTYMDIDDVFHYATETPWAAGNDGGWWGYASSHAAPRHGYDENGLPFFYLWDDPGTYFTVELATGSSPAATLVQQSLTGFPLRSVVDGWILRPTGRWFFFAEDTTGQHGFVHNDDDGSSDSFTMGPGPVPWVGVVADGSGTRTNPGIVLTPGQETLLLVLDGTGQLQSSELTVPSAPVAVVSRTNAQASQHYVVVGDDTGGDLWTQVTTLGSDAVAIPVEPGYLALFAPDLLTDDVTLFGVAPDGTLRVLSRSTGRTSTFYSAPGNGVPAPDNPADGAWTSVTVQQGAPTATPINTWRTTIRLTDGDGGPLPQALVTIAADRDVTVWQPGHTDAAGTPLTANTLISAPGPGVAFTTDLDGEITLAVPADALHTATYTVTTADGTAFHLVPDLDVHTTLTDPDGTLAASMQSATARDGSPLFGALTPPGDGSVGAPAQQAAAFVAQAMSAGLGLPLPTAAAVLGLGGFASADGPQLRSATTVRELLDLQSFPGWWDKAKHDAESAARGVEQGVVRVADDIATAATIAADATDAALHRISLVIAGAIEDTIDFVVTDAKSAVQAITGVFHALLQDATKGLDDILHWLKDKIFGFLEDVSAAADTMMSWLVGDGHGGDCASTRFQGVITRWQTSVDRDFTQLEADITSRFSAVQAHMSGQTLAGLRSSVPGPAGSTPAGLGSGGVGDPNLVQRLADVVHDVKADWLRDKIKNEQGLPTELGADVAGAFEGLVDDLKQEFDTLLADFVAIGSGIGTAVSSAVDARTGAAGFSLDTVFTDVGTLVHDLVALVQTLFDDVLTLLLAAWKGVVGFLNSSLDSLCPSGALLLDALGIGGLTVGKLLCMLITFPGTVFAQVRFGAGATMFSDSAAFSGGEANAAVGDGSGYGSFVDTAGLLGTLFWGLLDGTVDGFRLAAQSAGQTYTPPDVIAWLDLGFSLFANVVAYPFASTDGDPLSFDPVTGSTDHPNLPLYTWVAGFVPPLITFVALKLADGADGADESTVEDIDGAKTWLVCMAGLLLTVLDAWNAWNEATTDPSSDENATKTIAVVGNLTNVLSPLGLLADETLAVSDIVKVVFDIACPIIVFGSGLALLE